MIGSGIKGSRFWNIRLLAAVIAAFAILLYLVGKPIPIIIWDEGRIVINAIEMRHNGIGLVTTYDYHQDLWNTKPPLLIWLMTGSMSLFGTTEFALRLPSLVSSLGTVLLVMLFLYRITSSAAIAAFGGIALAASVAFFGEHGARTADYDALLTFFTTGYMMLLFFAVHRPRPPLRWLLLAGALGAGALMTKLMAGGIPGAGLLLYLTITRRWPRVLRNVHYLIGAILAVAPVLLFLVLREQADPGYLHAMIYNDVSGRFNEALDDHDGPPWYYVETTFISGLFSLGVAGLLSPLALPITQGRLRLAIVFSLCIALGQLVVVTMTSTKLVHYYLPAYPFVAIGTALAVHAILVRFRVQAESRKLPRYRLWIAMLVPALLVAHGVARAVDVDRTLLYDREHYPRARYGALLGALAQERAPLVVIEPGWSIPDDPHYAPELRFYMMVAHENGRAVTHAGELRGLTSAPPGAIVATCDPRVVPLLKVQVRKMVVERNGCVAGRKGA